jgi:hypothetical protein
VHTGSPAFIAEFFDQAGKPLFHLEEVGVLGKTGLKVITRIGDQTVTALVPQDLFRQWQEEMQRLTVSAHRAEPPKSPPQDKK